MPRGCGRFRMPLPSPPPHTSTHTPQIDVFVCHRGMRSIGQGAPSDLLFTSKLIMPKARLVDVSFERLPSIIVSKSCFAVVFREDVL